MEHRLTSPRHSRISRPPIPGAIDLHSHSRASDGLLPPERVVGAALERGLRVLALTDHDTIDGLPAARAAARGRLELVPGVELSCSPTDRPALEGTVHVVGLMIEETHPELLEELDAQSTDRQRRIAEMTTRLVNLGYPITLDDVRRQAGSGNPGRPHIARALVEAGVVPSVSGAFSAELIGDGGRAYVPRRAVTPVRAIELIRRAGGVAVLAHPGVIALSHEVLSSLVEELSARGLAGLEVDHPDHPSEVREKMAALARREGLVAVGASDCHGSLPLALGTESTSPEAWARLVSLRP
jgi:3',5'-nucleoside bisphosphate phosphatase